MSRKFGWMKPRFSLWAMLVLVTVVAIPLSYVAQRRSFNLRRKAAWEVLRESGFQFEQPIVLSAKKGSAPTSWDRWLRSLCLEDAVLPVSSVSISDARRRNGKVTDDDLLQLALFPEIRNLRIEAAEGITDRAMSVVANFPQLEGLGVEQSPKITSRLLEAVPRLKSLSLDVQFDAAHIPALQKQTELAMLGIRNAPLTDEDLSFLGDCDQLDTLVLEGVPIRGAILAKLNRNAPMHFLTIRGAPISDASATELRRLPRLVHLDLAWTTLEGDFLPETGAWPMLQFVDFQGVRFSDAGKRKLVQLKVPFHITYPSNWSALDFQRYDSVKVPSDITINLRYAAEAKENSIAVATCYPPNFQPPKISNCSTESMAGVIALLEMAKAEEAEWKAKEKQDGGSK